jgi:hypothetical protein
MPDFKNVGQNLFKKTFVLNYVRFAKMLAAKGLIQYYYTLLLWLSEPEEMENFKLG